MQLIDKFPKFELSEKSNYCELDNFELAILLVENLVKLNRNIIVVKNNLYQATLLYNEILNYIDDVELFGFDESLVVETVASSPELLNQRLNTLSLSIDNKPKIIITHTLGISKPFMPVAKYQSLIKTIKQNDEVNLKELGVYLNNIGYKKVSKVNLPLEYAIRGNVVDVFPFNHNMPIRIDTFDDEVEFIKYFDVASQRTRIKIEEVIFYPATIYNNEDKAVILNKIEDLTNDSQIIDNIKDMSELYEDLFYSRYYNLLDDTNSIINYFEDALIISASLKEISDTYTILYDEANQYLTDLEKDKMGIADFELFLPLYENEFSIDIKAYRSNSNQESMNLFPIEKIKDTVQLLKQIKEYQKDGYDINIVLKSHKEIELIKKDLIDITNLNYFVADMSRGFIEHKNKVIFYSENELFSKIRKKRNNLSNYSNAISINDLEELKIGDYLVHNIHGIGEYLGIVQLKVDRINKDFLHIKYQNDEKLYIPMEQFNLVKKFSSTDAVQPKLSKLGGSDWKKTKIKVQKKIEDMMDELLELYASRQEAIGYAFEEDSILQEEFDNDFEYELTPDQKQAIEDVKKDMESNIVMDRLICGDVGFGKTEVAIRAIFKAVLSGKQVAFLCPTTILARQHYLTLLDRYQNYPINVALLTRNVTTKNVNLIKKDLADGLIDVVIGTHKILGKDIEFKDLGLLVVDEEQRFGVKAKEKIKQLKNNVDVLTLSATPIPRTLQMSLTGLRQTSLLQTPPINRVPIQTYVVEKNDYLIKEVIERELMREGQVFYLYNKTSDIDKVAENIQELFDGVKVGYIHGKMNKNEIEEVMNKFDSNEYQILVSTTIIENGIDIPNANTIIIEDANLFGLAQLYQIKGRVGRSDKVGYAYFLYQKNKIINEEAQKRLQAIKELTKLGSGYKIALRDLSIRGAGDLLGKSQAGNIEAVGYDMYIEMLEEEMAKRQNKVIKQTDIENINLKNVGALPHNYLDDNNKIMLYQKINKIDSLKDFKELIDELKDTYGRLPGDVVDLIEKRRLEILIDLNPKVKIIDEADKLILQMDVNVKDNDYLKAVYHILDSYNPLFKVSTKYNKLFIETKKTPGFLKSLNQLIYDLKKNKLL